MEEKSGPFTKAEWISVVVVVVVLVIVITTATSFLCHRKRRLATRDGASDTRSENPTVVTSVSEHDQYPMGQYPFGDLPDLPANVASHHGTVPIYTTPDLLEGAVASDHEDQSQGLKTHKEEVPPPLYDGDKSDLGATDNKPPPYSP